MAEAYTDRKSTVTTSTTPDEKRPDDNDDFLATARKRFMRVVSAESINRKDGIDDLMFKNGAQWPDNIRTDRTIQKRPCLTINKMKTFVHQVVNNQKQNRPAINISPVGDGDKNTATMLKGLIRQIERNCDATIAYDTAFDSAVSNGWGYWRLLTDYEDDKSFNQVIKVVPIRNPFRVYLDPDHQLPDGSDAKWGFISDMIPREEFEAQWPKADPIAWAEGALGDEYKDWSSTTHVRIAEYFCYETENRTLIALASGEVVYKDELPEEALKLIESEGGKELVKNEREVESQKVKWVKMTAHEVLEENEWAGKWIPIVKVSGDVIDIEGRVSLSGLIRDAKDPQRMKNYWATAKTELIALAPKAPWVMEEGQIEGHEQRWQQANQKSYPYLLYKGTSISGKAAPPPQRQGFAGPPAGVIEAEQSAEQDMMGTTGVRFDATKSERIPDESGKALKELKFLGELGSFHYVDNLVHSLKFTARQLIDLIPKIYDAPRVVTILREDDSEETVKIDPQLAVPFQPRPENGKVMKLYNPGLGKYDVAVTVGPNFQTKRSESAEGMLGFMKAMPNAAPVIAGPVARNMDWPGSDEIADRLDALVPPHIIGKSLEKMGDIPPQARALIGGLQQQLQVAKQELQQAVMQLNEKRGDQQIDLIKIQKDYDAKIAKIAADMKMHIDNLISDRLGAVENRQDQKSEANRDQFNKDADRQMTDRQMSMKSQESPT